MRDAQDRKDDPPGSTRSPEQRREDRLDEELEETFPASDPVSAGSVLPGAKPRD
jgi:hypothetical protein